MQNNIDIKSKKLVIGILIFIVLLQVGIRIYAGTQKVAYHWDEPLSYSLINYDAMHASDRVDFFEKWNSGRAFFDDYYQINKDEVWNWKPVYENQKNDVHPPIYYILLRCAATFTIDDYSKWTGIGLNIAISIVSTIVVYFIAEELIKNKLWALLTCFAVTTSITAVETTIFIRMYELVMLNFLLLTLWFVKNYNKESLDDDSLILFVLCLITGFLTQYYYLIFAVGITLTMIIKLIKLKRIKESIKLIISSLIASVTSIILFSPCIKHLLYSDRGMEAAKNIENFTDIWNKIVEYLNLIADHTFNVNLMIIDFALLFFLVVFIIKKIHIEKRIVLLSIISAFYAIVIVKISPYIEIRYVCAICPILIVIAVYLLKVSLEAILKDKIALCIGIVVLLLIFSISIQRYNKTIYSFYDEKNVVEAMKGNTILAIQQGDKFFNITPEEYSIFYDSDMFYYMWDTDSERIINVLNQLNNKSELYVLLLQSEQEQIYVDKILNTKIYNTVENIGKFRSLNVYKFK